MKDKLSYLIIMTGINCVIVYYLYVFKAGSFLLYSVPSLVCFGMGAGMLLEYMKKRRFYKSLSDGIKGLDKKYIFTELIEPPDFLEGRLFYEAAASVNQNMADEINLYKENIREYKEYIELWVHEIKTPLASSRLILENNAFSAKKSMEEELWKVERYIEQTLYYSKIDMVEKDYKIREYSLEEIIHKVIRNHKQLLMGKKINIRMENVDKAVLTDSKWLVFILGQIVSNSIKYMEKEEKELSFFADKKHNQVRLWIRDNGIGISPWEAKKVTEKGFVGSNGRKTEASTGMGLYICKRLLDKMNHGFAVYSAEGKETRVCITFPRAGHMSL